MNKNLIVFAIFLLVLTACAGVQVGKTKEQAAMVDDTHKGFKGVIMTFAKNNPPDLAFANTPLNIVVELKNEGPAVASGTLYISGYDTNMFNLAPREKSFELEGRTKFNTYGGYESAEFSSGNIYLPRGTDTLDQNFLVSACYRYRTEASIPVCIDPNPASLLDTEACKVTNPVVAGGQGGPVGVTAVREDAAPGQVSFLLTIANQGDGQVIDLASLANCPDRLGFNDVDNVQYTVRMSGVNGNCKPVGKTRLASKQGTIYCTFVLADSTSPAYTSVLEVNLDYAYLSRVSKNIKIKSLTG